VPAIDTAIKALVVDDHEVVRTGIAALLGREPDIEIVGTVASGEEALEMLCVLLPDVVILDHRLRGMSGAATCREIMRRRPATSVIGLTTFLEDAIIHQFLAAGARGYLLKDTRKADLVHAVRSVARGETILGAQIIDRVVRWAYRAKALYEDPSSLAPQEVLALSLAAEGLSNREIAEEMRMSSATVKLYLRTAMRKLGARQRAEAVAAGIRLGVI
jgi:DNA-binding NarL/FixJ family response regulator